MKLLSPDHIAAMAGRNQDMFGMLRMVLQPFPISTLQAVARIYWHDLVATDNEPRKRRRTMYEDAGEALIAFVLAMEEEP